MPRTVTYYFGRVNVVSQQHDKNSIYATALIKSPTATTLKAHTWGFSDVKVSQEDRLGEIYEGYLVKYRDQEAVEVVDLEARTIEDENVRNLVAAHSRFFLHVRSGIIAYHPVGHLIPGPAFVARFAELIERAYGSFFISVEILPVNELETLHEAMRQFSRIDRLSIYLHPSNPSNRKVWRRVDERLRSINATDLHEQYQGKNSDGGLRPDADKSIGRKIAMAEDGYRHSQVTGILNGKRKTVSTRSRPLSAEAPGDSEPSDSVIRALSDQFLSILRRFSE